MLQLASRAYFVGVTAPPLPAHIEHLPRADIAAIARRVLEVG